HPLSLRKREQAIGFCFRFFELAGEGEARRERRGAACYLVVKAEGRGLVTCAGETFGYFFAGSARVVVARAGAAGAHGGRLVVNVFLQGLDGRLAVARAGIEPAPRFLEIACTLKAGLLVLREREGALRHRERVGQRIRRERALRRACPVEG